MVCDVKQLLSIPLVLLDMAFVVVFLGTPQQIADGLLLLNEYLPVDHQTRLPSGLLCLGDASV